MIVELAFTCLLAQGCMGPVPHSGDLFTHREDCEEIAAYLTNKIFAGYCVEPAPRQSVCNIGNLEFGPKWSCLWPRDQTVERFCRAKGKEFPPRGDDCFLEDAQ